jgi:hydroxyacylglutathione hydrolase
MIIQQIFFKNTLRNFSYLITFNDEAIFCLDPFKSSEIVDFLGPNKKLKGLFITHDHCDHFGGAKELADFYQAPIFAHSESQLPFHFQGIGHDQLLYKDDVWELKAIYTPGHTSTHLCLVLIKEKAEYAVFTGDCLFNAGVGNCHNGGNPEVLYETISNIFGKMSDDILIYPGHEYLKKNLEFTLNVEPTNTEAHLLYEAVLKKNLDNEHHVFKLGYEKEINSFLRLKKSEIKKQLNLESGSDKEVFLTLRQLRNTW